MVTGRLRRWVLALNTAGFALFLVWMVSLRDRAILREQDGILYFMPCLPFLFVYLLMMPPKETGKKGEEGKRAEEAGKGTSSTGAGSREHAPRQEEGRPEQHS